MSGRNPETEDTVISADSELQALNSLASNNDPNLWSYGNVIHNANSILGLAALQRGDKNAAVSYLLLAGDTPGSPQLNTFGPRMLLARRLVEVGEKAAVCAYLDKIARFWGPQEIDASFRRKLSPIQSLLFQALAARNRRLIEKWKIDIQNGKIPDYGLWNANPLKVASVES